MINGCPDMTEEGMAALARAFGPAADGPMFNLRGWDQYCISHDVKDCPDCQAAERARSEARKAESERAKRVEEIERWYRGAHQSEDDLGGLPRFPFADYDNQEWVRRVCCPLVFNGIKRISLREDATFLGPTGSPKTSSIRARVKAEYVALLKAAQVGPVSLPPRITYCTGYELTEASKRRAYSDGPHGLTRAAMRAPMLVLDEVHSLHTSLVELFAVLDVRDRAGLPTIVLTGMTMPEISAWVGAASLRRLLKGEVIDGYAEPKKVRAVR